MGKTFYLLILLNFLSTNIAAQQIVVSKDNLRLYNSNTLFIYNTDSSPLVIDSLYSAQPAYGYWLTISTKDSTLPYYFARYYNSSLKLELGKNDTARFIFETVDLCTVCKIASINDIFKDTLRIISNSQQKDSLLLYVEGDGIPSSIENANNIFLDYKLYQSYPNPFNPITTIKYAVPHLSYVSLKVYDLLGREVKTLVDEPKVAGEYYAIFDAANLSSGVYYYRLAAGNFMDIKKLVLLK